MTDFRALCARMADELDHYRQLLMDDRRATHALATEARAALEAQPEPQGPTDEELLRCYGLAKRDHCYEGPIDDWPKRAERAATVHGLHAVLTRYGRPAIEPVPVSERLPGPEDCDAEGRCWWFSPPAWMARTIRPCWTLDSETLEGDTHWLPHWALPMPVVEDADG
jgi:hypothetical protein